MKSYLLATFAMGALSLTHCAGQPRATVQAAGVERMQCDASVTSQDSLVRSIVVLHVQPLYSHVRTANTSEERVNGANFSSGLPRA